MGKDLNGKELGKGLSQRADGMYYGRIMIDGVRIVAYSMKLSKCKEELKEKKNRLIAERALGLDIRKTKTLTLDEWFNEWFVTYKVPYLKESSVTPLRTKYRMTFSKTLGDMKIKDITNMDVQRAINFLHEDGISASALKDGLGLLRGCFDVAQGNKVVLGNPSIGVKVPWKAKLKGFRVLTREEQRVFLQFCEGSWYKEMLYVMFGTGMRIGEVGGLKWGDINWANKTITIKRALMAQYEDGVKKIKLTSPKTINSYRDIPFFDQVEESLRSQKEKQDRRIKELGKRRWRQEGELSDFVFTSSFGSPILRHIAEKEINKITSAINQVEWTKAKEEEREPIEFARLYPHAIRHTFCTRLFEKGVDPKVVQLIMGHSQLSTTMDIYTHVTKEKMLKDVGGIDGIANPKHNE